MCTRAVTCRHSTRSNISYRFVTAQHAGTGPSNFETEFDFVDNETIVFVGGNAGGGNGFVAPSAGVYEVFVGSTVPDFLYQLFIEKPIHITSTALPTATVGADCSAVLTADGGRLPRIWSVSAGALDAGLAVNSEGGLSEVAGTYTFTVSVLGGSIAQKQFTLTVNP